MVQWLKDVRDWDGTRPAVLVISGVAQDERRDLLKALAARALGLEPAAIVIEHRAQAAPSLVHPVSPHLFLSSASREGWAVVAAARTPIGVDVEAVDSAGEIPWNVLHPAEGAFLTPLHGEAQARAFARLWSLKEAYVKALRVGLREADSFAVHLRDNSALIDDPLASAHVADALTVWRSAEGRCAAVSAVVMTA